MKTRKPPASQPLITGTKVESAPGAAFKVVTFSLSAAGTQMLTSKSGALMRVRPDQPAPKKAEPA